MNTKFDPAKAAIKAAQKQRSKTMRRARNATVLVLDEELDRDLGLPDREESRLHAALLVKKWKSVLNWEFYLYEVSMERIEQCEPFEYAEEQIKTLDPGIQIKVYGHMERPFDTSDYDEPDSIMWGVVVFGNGEMRRWHATHIGYQGGKITIQPLPGVPAGADHTIESDDRAMVFKFSDDDKVVAAKSWFDPCDPEVRYVHPETGDLIHWIEWYTVDRRIHRSAREWTPPLVQTVDGVALEWEGVGYPALQTRDVIKLLMRHHPVSRSMPECDWRDTSWS
jgi:hypothetical protein